MNPVSRAANLISEAEGLLITAGAGMGVDSGLPDFRSTEGFWAAYPALASARLDFRSIATPAAFVARPSVAWGFYGHRLSLYRDTLPHDGFKILKEIATNMPKSAFVVTSNVDGHFQKAGFSESQVMEIHGSIHRLQCLGPCSGNIWSAKNITPTIDHSKCEWVGAKLPACPKCRQLARPNILMFNDFHWIDTYTKIGRIWFERWLDSVSRFVVLEIGAGIGLPSIRQLGRSFGVPLIRINPQRDSDCVEVHLASGAQEGLKNIINELESVGWIKSP